MKPPQPLAQSNINNTINTTNKQLNMELQSFYDKYKRRDKMYINKPDEENYFKNLTPVNYKIDDHTMNTRLKAITASMDNIEKKILIPEKEL